MFYSDDHNTVVADVTGCYRRFRECGRIRLSLSRRCAWATESIAVVNADVRESTMRNHTATHLLHAGLREVLGKHVKQAGSLVAPNHLRFDFSHFTAVEDEELQDIEDIINKEVLRNQIVETITDVPIDEAISTYHAMACSAKSMAIRYAWCASAISRPNFARHAYRRYREIGLIRF